MTNVERIELALKVAKAAKLMSPKHREMGEEFASALLEEIKRTDADAAWASFNIAKEGVNSETRGFDIAYRFICAYRCGHDLAKELVLNDKNYAYAKMFD